MKTVWNSKYFYGNKISEYGLQHGYIDYATLAKSFDCVLVNDITKLFFANVNNEYSEYELINGFIDNSEEIEKLEDEIFSLENILDNIEDIESVQYITTKEELEKLEEEKEDLENEQDNFPEIYQYYIISDNGAKILEELTEEIVFYIPILDCYVWGVTHWGTSWDYVLTDIKLELNNN